MTRRRLALAALAAALVLVGCTDPNGGGDQTSSGEPTPSTTSPSATPSETPTAEPTLAWGPTEAELEQAMTDAAALSDEEAAGQVLIGTFSGTDPAAAGAAVTDLGLGGVIVFAGNVASLEQMIAVGDAVQEAVGATRDWPGIVSVDNEGGIVQRLSAQTGPWTTFPPFQVAGAASGSPEVVSAAYEAMGRELLASGITMNFAPDADVTVGPSDVTIGSRSAGSDPDRVAQTVVAAYEGFSAGGMLTSAKHFPGHGSLDVDSHESLPVLDIPTAELASRDLVPFEAAVEAGVPAVMMGHIAVSDWDPGVPASLSPAAYSYLRDELGFTGVAVTDGLDMGALTSTWSDGEIAAQALIAGADLLLGPTDLRAARDGILGALADGSLSRDRLTEAAGRVIALVRWQAELAQRAGAEPADVGASAPELADLAAAAVTLVAGECSGSLAGPRIHVRGGTEDVWNAFVATAQEAGLEVVPLEQPADTDVRLLTAGSDGSAAADVAIALDSPYPLAASPAQTQVAAYGSTPEAMAAAVAVLTGAASAPGRLPVEVGDLPASVC
ncbi:glycoside hydrolase family 3 N-terminal domain-containing protein [Pseudactinotalea terrae]|uniref:glycoside hydrolase family 3 N-terminal domain-containing protein n=1 Tax=Pseudactinotalea terrae TaxID=1743262 RepID=UPI0012E1A851|nr:glycoside hydrolase family 3 N-terminal domain-containing protein [Pseudactinotalea terrae]